MEKINRCLKLSFIIYNSMVLSSGILMLLTLLILRINGINGIIDDSITGGVFTGMWIYAICALPICVLGLRAGRKEEGLLLKIFAGLLMVPLVANLVLGSITVVNRDLVYRRRGPESLLQDFIMQQQLIRRQQNEECCGLVSARDWGSNIPQSCACGDGYPYIYRSDCIDAPKGSDGPRRVYRKPCGMLAIRTHTANGEFEAAIGVFFGVAAVFLLDFIMTVVMIMQVQHSDVTASVGRAEPLSLTSDMHPGVPVVHL